MRRSHVAVVLALASAVVYGASDFLGGLASRRTSVFGVVAMSQLVGLVALVALLPWLGGPVDGADLAWGAAAGLAGAAGLVIFFRPLAGGVMSLVAPEGGLSALRAARPAALAPALLAGTMFGFFFVLLDRTSSESGLTPLVTARLASVGLVVVIALAGRQSLRVTRAALPLVAVSGVGDMTANALFLLATQADGQLAITGVLASLYPVSTVVLAQVVLRERLVGAQVTGLLAAAAAVVLITLPA